jgi:predicted DsbA family dithiol-disulfide isomerase
MDEMTIKVKVYSDYVCPFCFIAEKPLEEAIEGKDVEVEWMPFELRPYPNETLRPEGDYLKTIWKQAVYPYAEHFGLNIVLPRVSPQPHTHLAFEGYQFAKEHGKGNEYNDLMFRYFFQQEKDIGNVAILVEAAKEVGLNEVEFKAALEERRYKGEHEKALKHAFEEANITAVPTFMIGNQVLRGMQTKENLIKAIENAEGKQKSFPMY